MSAVDFDPMATQPMSLEATAFAWPSPPYAAFPGSTRLEEPLACEVESMSGTRRNCLLVSLQEGDRSAIIQVPPTRISMPLRFGKFRRLSLKRVLQPTATATHQPHALLLDYRPLLDYHIMLKGGGELTGKTVGHVETNLGVFLFPPADDKGAVEQVFIPTEAYAEARFGKTIGQVLVEQQSVTAQQVEQAAKEQEDLRNRKLGDYLVHHEIVSPDQLLLALDQQSRMPLVRLGEALVALKLVTASQLADALEKQKMERTVPLGELLVRNGVISRQDLHTALARKMGYPVVEVENFALDTLALKKIPFSLAQRLNVLPLLLRDRMLIVGTSDPTRRRDLDEIEFFSQCKVVPALASDAQITATLLDAYSKAGLDTSGGMQASGQQGPGERGAGSGKGDAKDLLATLEQEQAAEMAAAGEAVENPIEQSDNSLVKLINTMILDARDKGASDIHVESHPAPRKMRIRFRRDGVMAPYLELPHTYRSAFVARIKIMCDLDISERRKPQDGKIDFSRFVPGVKLELRVASIPTANGMEDVVMRLLASAKPIPMEGLGLSPNNTTRLQDAIERPYGMVLCVGPTGSGKTTTLHSVLGHLNTPERKIWTAEDPVEITQPDLRQVQVNPKIGWTFAKALRAFLRADPDIIMVGEIRDEETAQTAIEASLTGHLVLSTLHTNSAAETVTRLLDMGMDPFNFADSLLAVLAQRLVRRLCNECKRSDEATDAQVTELLEDYLHCFPESVRPAREAILTDWMTRFGRNGKLMHTHAPGCSRCDGTGLKGRAGLHELMTINPGVRRLIQTSARPEEIQAEAMAHGELRTLRQDGIEKVLSGFTTIEEVRANCNG
jgi:type II secretory ATPase GspE/PulE/Tfp pilus assembly ATPase PilB-like protein